MFCVHAQFKPAKKITKRINKTKVSLQYNSQTCHSDLHHRPCLPHNTESLPGERWKGWGGKKNLFVTMETPLKSEVFHLKKIGGEGEFFTLEILL